MTDKSEIDFYILLFLFKVSSLHKSPRSANVFYDSIALFKFNSKGKMAANQRLEFPKILLSVLRVQLIIVHEISYGILKLASNFHPKEPNDQKVLFSFSRFSFSNYIPQQCTSRYHSNFYLFSLSSFWISTSWQKTPPLKHKYN